mmetsp:Transcript_1366/g.2980  ORF Transcript_1366/g.2980 Transcript_1366/m.2980 type:complete len:259 (-) Transcript_1366:253-1029(-)
MAVAESLRPVYELTMATGYVICTVPPTPSTSSSAMVKDSSPEPEALAPGPAPALLSLTGACASSGSAPGSCLPALACAAPPDLAAAPEAAELKSGLDVGCNRSTTSFPVCRMTTCKVLSPGRFADASACCCCCCLPLSAGSSSWPRACLPAAAAGPGTPIGSAARSRWRTTCAAAAGSLASLPSARGQAQEQLPPPAKPPSPHQRNHHVSCPGRWAERGRLTELASPGSVGGVCPHTMRSIAMQAASAPLQGIATALL